MQDGPRNPYPALAVEVWTPRLDSVRRAGGHGVIVRTSGTRPQTRSRPTRHTSRGEFSRRKRAGVVPRWARKARENADSE